MKYYIIAGEASGDLHASNLMRSLSKLDPEAEYRGLGGDRMISCGLQAVKHIREVAFMGFTEVISHLPEIMKNFRIFKKDILQWRADVVILVDYPGFNLRMAEFLHRSGLRVFYYISPQVWAWKKSRVYKIRRTVDRMFVILPFEKEFYSSYDMDVDYEGHPLLDAIENFNSQPSPGDFRTANQLGGLPIIALLPGSRKQEISRMLVEMTGIVNDFPWYTFVIAASPDIPLSFYSSIVGDIPVKIVRGQTYRLLQHSTAALVTSGTATLETALFNVPEVVCYKGSAISYHIARRLIKVPYISLVNLILGKASVKELIQQDLNHANLCKELSSLLGETDAKNSLLADYRELKLKLGGGGASDRIAAKMWSLLQQGKRSQRLSR